MKPNVGDKKKKNKNKGALPAFPGVPSCPPPFAIVAGARRFRSAPAITAPRRVQLPAAESLPGSSSMALQNNRRGGRVPRPWGSWRGSCSGPKGLQAPWRSHFTRGGRIGSCRRGHRRGARAGPSAWRGARTWSPGGHSPATLGRRGPEPAALRSCSPAPARPSRGGRQPPLPRNGIPSSPGPALSEMERIGKDAAGGQGAPGGSPPAGFPAPWSSASSSPVPLPAPGPRTNRLQTHRQERRPQP